MLLVVFMGIKMRKKSGLMVLLVALLLGILGGYFYFLKQKEEIDARFDIGDYEGLFFTMYDMPGFKEEYFVTYRGLKIKKVETISGQLEIIANCVKSAEKEKGKIEAVYLGIEPVKLWEATGKKDKWKDYVEDELLKLIKQFPRTTFEILLPNPPLSYWSQLANEEFSEILSLYEALSIMLAGKDNVRLFFLGAEEWLICNGDNYVNQLSTNDAVSKHIFLSTFCDGKYQVDRAGLKVRLEELRQKVESEKQTPTVYPDLSFCDIVFMGDSIIGLDRASTSIPGVVSALSKARTYNLAQGGLTATLVKDKHSFLTVIEMLTDRAMPEEEEGAEFVPDMRRFLEREVQTEKLVFVINYGLNDYFQGEQVEDPENKYNAETYAGALRTGIDKLKKKYPNAEIVIMGPTYTSFFTEGTERMSDRGGLLEDYRCIAEKVAVEKQVWFKNNYKDLGINKDNESVYLNDGCHMNYQGRFLYGVQIVEFLNKALGKNE